MLDQPDPTFADGPLLATKLFAPRWRSGLISRPALVERLRANAGRKLTLVSAPAGFGKSTLLAEWLEVEARAGRTTAWLSIDTGDNDPALFWSYVLTAIQVSWPVVGGAGLALVRSPQPPRIETILTSLLSELAMLDDDVTLVLDDYHLIESQSIHSALIFLIEHLPPRVRVVIASRADPPLPLARLRARSDAVELRASDLRFTPAEAAAFLNDAMGLSLDADDVARLEQRTEGWIAGLQLAALSQRDRGDASGFIQQFAGDHRYIVDYLADEVLRAQPTQVRDFLLRTSILDRLSAPLCDAVTGETDSIATLDTLERRNLFLVPLDDRRLWYRYHHLFADVLAAHLIAERPDDLSLLHGRASLWFERNGATADAIRHAFDAGDVARAADLIEPAARVTSRNRQETTLRGWLRQLPEGIYENRPVLSLVAAGASMSTGSLEGVEARLADAERWLSPDDPDGRTPAVIDEEEFQRLPTGIAVYRSALALARGNLPDTIANAQRALASCAAGDHMWRGAASALLGLAAWATGELDTAFESYTAGMTSLQRAGNIADAIGGVIAPADIRIAQGRLRDALRIYEGALALSREHGNPYLRGTADVYVGFSEYHRERGDFDTAAEHLATALELGEPLGFPQFAYRSRLERAALASARGDLDGALMLLIEAQQVYVSDFHPNLRPIAARIARHWLLMGRLDDALAWLRDNPNLGDGDVYYLREFEHVTVARIQIGRFRLDGNETDARRAIELLQRLVSASEAGGRVGSSIDILIQLALAHEALDDSNRAIAHLERALALAEPEGYVHIFAREGDPLRHLIAMANARGVLPAYTGRILHAFRDIAPAAPTPLPEEHRASQTLPESLSDREIEVLRLIEAGLSNRDICDRLYLALDTVKGHNRRIFGKLGVQRRTEAIARARELGIL